MNGICYDTPAQTLTAFQMAYPLNTANSISALVSSSVAGTPGTITYSVRVHDLLANTANTRTGTVVLQNCTMPLPTDFFGTFMIIAALSVLVVLGFQVGRAR